MRRLCLVVAVVVASMTAVSCRHDQPRNGSSTTTSSTGPPVTAPDTTTTLPPSRPAALVAAQGGALVRLDPATGARRSTIVSAAGLPGVGIGAVSLDRVHDIVYYDTLAGSDCLFAPSGSIWRVPLAGDPPTRVAAGTSPAVSADGTLLAYVAETCHRCVPDDPRTGCQAPFDPHGTIAGDELRVRTLATGADYAITSERHRDQTWLFVVDQLSWSPDNATIALSAGTVQDNEGREVRLVAAHPGPGLDTAPTVKPLPLGSVPYVSPATYLPDGTLFAHEGCCEGWGNLAQASRLLVVDPTTGARIAQVATGFPERSHHDLVADATGAWLLYGLDNDLMVSGNRDRPTTLAHNVSAAAW